MIRHRKESLIIIGGFSYVRARSRYHEESHRYHKCRCGSFACVVRLCTGRAGHRYGRHAARRCARSRLATRQESARRTWFPICRRPRPRTRRTTPRSRLRRVSTGTTGGIPYCLVKLLVKPAINIWVGLPMGGNWNGRLQSEGGGGYAGSVGIPTGSIAAGYIGVQTDTGHTGGSGTFGCVNDCAGATQASPARWTSSARATSPIGRSI